jgi:hypothetical protein
VSIAAFTFELKMAKHNHHEEVVKHLEAEAPLKAAPIAS